MLLGACALLLLAAVLAAAHVSRQSALSRRAGSFTCLLHGEPGGSADAWSSGWAQYCPDRLVWWRSLSFAPRPAQTWSRTDLRIVDRVLLAEHDDAGDQVLVVHCAHRGERFALRMSAPAAAGLVSWLESAPRPVGRVV